MDEVLASDVQLVLMDAHASRFLNLLWCSLIISAYEAILFSYSSRFMSALQSIETGHTHVSLTNSTGFNTSMINQHSSMTLKEPSMNGTACSMCACRMCALSHRFLIGLMHTQKSCTFGLDRAGGVHLNSRNAICTESSKVPASLTLHTMPNEQIQKPCSCDS